MYRLEDIQDALLHVVGWENSLNPNNKIDDAMTISESGLTFQGAHPLCTLNNIRSIMPDEWELQYPQWNITTSYNKGAKVKFANAIYKAISPNVGIEPNDEAYWQIYNPVSDFVERLTRNGINLVIQTFIQVKQLNKETRNLMERRTFFDGAGRIKATIDNTHKLVGYEINPVRAMGVTAKIERIGLQMIGATGIVKLYLFHSSQVDPIKTFELEFTNTNGGFQWFSIADCYLPYISDANNTGGSWYLCYNQNELPEGMRAINVSKDWSREPCGTCIK